MKLLKNLEDIENVRNFMDVRKIHFRGANNKKKPGNVFLMVNKI